MANAHRNKRWLFCISVFVFYQLKSVCGTPSSTVICIYITSLLIFYCLLTFLRVFSDLTCSPNKILKWIGVLCVTPYKIWPLLFSMSFSLEGSTFVSGSISSVLFLKMQRCGYNVFGASIRVWSISKPLHNYLTGSGAVSIEISSELLQAVYKFNTRGKRHN